MFSDRCFSSFPFEPYPIQVDFMNALFDVLEGKRIGLFESPTGTGKTLSLICASLEWLKKNKQLVEPLKESDPEGNEPEWLLQQLKDLSTAQTSKPLAEKKRPRRRRGDADEFLLNDGDEDCFESSSVESSDNEDVCQQRQLIYCSRTHSQLSQFISELRRTKHAKEFSVVTLASRKPLCINEDVKRLSSLPLMNERCLDLQDKKASKKSKTGTKLTKKSSKTGNCGCPYFANKDKSRESDMVKQILSEPMDIEALHILGKSNSICPYYSARSSVKKADIVLLPYSSLLSEDTKNSLGLTTDGNILIIDEAHNLPDAINNTHKATISESVLRDVLEMLNRYNERFENCLSESNSQNLKVLLRILNQMLKFCQRHMESKSLSQTVNQFLFETGLDDVNLLKSVKWIHDSKLAFKVTMYKKSACEESEESGALGKVFACVSFLKALQNEDQNCRIILEQNSKSHELQLMIILLNPAVHFEKILESCHSVILASGTLSPLSLIKTQLFENSATHDRITTFSCQHVVPKEQVLALALTSGLNGQTLNFKFENRTKLDMLNEVANILLKLCNIVPGGFVAFVPSFSYLEALITHLQHTEFFETINQKKMIFVELQESTKSEEMLKKYKKQCTVQEGPKNGALLLSVVGGKMSEGINFGDEYGRCVLMIGLPFPNSQDLELQERLNHLKKQKHGLLDKHEYYEDLCMKAVNQSIGRVIRHAKDYSCIILADNRYSNRNIVQKLPEWIKSSIAGNFTFAAALSEISHFYQKLTK